MSWSNIPQSKSSIKARIADHKQHLRHLKKEAKPHLHAIGKIVSQEMRIDRKIQALQAKLHSQ